MPQKESRLRKVLTVSEVTRDIKLILENTFPEVWVEGEASGIRKIATGTTFFALKDSASLLKCVMFGSSAKEVKFDLKDGMQVICFGRIGLYEKEGQYQLYAEKIEPKGIGSLQLALEQLKIKLEKEGLFSPQHKRPIPYLPKRIGIVTSATGAAIKDILKVLDRRFADVHIIIASCLVQGEGAGKDIAASVQDLNRFNETLPPNERIEVMIVGRGGGSVEDLWAFNEEIVARAIYNSKIPVISAVGHERDWSIADLVADLRAATPSVAAELVIPKREDLQEKLNSLLGDLKKSLQGAAMNFQEDIDNLAHRMSQSAQNYLKLSAGSLATLREKLAVLNPLNLLSQYKIKIEDSARQIHVRLQHYLQLRQAELRTAAQKLSSLSPLNILSRGYSITFKLPEGQVVKDAMTLKTGDLLSTRIQNGEIISSVKEVKKNG